MGLQKLKHLIESEAKALLTGTALALDVWDATTPEIVEAWQVLDAVKDQIEAKLKLLRDRLMEEAEQTGVKTEKAGYELDVDDATVIKEKREAKLPEEEKLKELLAKKKLKVSEGFTEKTTWVIDPSKLKSLVMVGKLKQKEIDDLCKVSWALKVKPAPYLDALLAGFLPPPDELEEEAPEPAQSAPAVERSKRLVSAGARKSK